MKPIHELIRSFKERRGLVDEQLGELFGVSQTTASDWVQGRKVPADTKSARIADVLGLTEDEVAASISYTRRRRATDMNEAMALLTQLQSEVAALTARLDRLERGDDSEPPRARSRRR